MQRGPGGRFHVPTQTGKLFLSALLLVGLSACAGQNSQTEIQPAAVATRSAGQPISLFGNDKSSLPAAPAASVKAALNQVAINRAIRNYQISKKLPGGPFRTIGADLNGDGRAEALVYLTGEKWCAPSGCTLTVFAPTKHGYKPMSTIRRVKAPIKASATASVGWRNLIVVTGAGIFEQTVELPFNGTRYPGNATLMKRLPNGADIHAEQLISAGANPVFPSGKATEIPRGSVALR